MLRRSVLNLSIKVVAVHTEQCLAATARIHLSHPIRDRNWSAMNASLSQGSRFVVIACPVTPKLQGERKSYVSRRTGARRVRPVPGKAKAKQSLSLPLVPSGRQGTDSTLVQPGALAPSTGKTRATRWRCALKNWSRRR